MVATTVASISGMTRHSLTWTPSTPSSVARYWMLESRVRPLRISLPMTTMQAVTVFVGSDISALFFLVFQDTSGRPAGGQAPHGLVRASIACQIWSMSSPRDFIDDSDDYWRRDERTIKVHGPEGFEGM